MRTIEHTWNRLCALARREPADRADETAPFGFSAEITTRWMEEVQSSGGPFQLWERLATRALVVACILTALAALASWSAVDTDATHEGIADIADPVVSSTAQMP